MMKTKSPCTNRRFPPLQLHWLGVITILVLATVAIQAVAEEQEGYSAEVRRLVAQLDHDSFSMREAAFQKLSEIGLPALPELQKASGSASFEQRQRARLLAADIQRRVLREAFIELAKQDDEVLDLEQGMWLISRMIDPTVRRDDLTRQLDDLADRVRTRLGKDVNPRTAEPRKVVEAIQHVLFTDLGFAGNRDDYNNPQNSSLAHVLATRKGLPILLSLVVVSVGKRLHAPLVGIGVPGRFMVKYDGARAPDGAAKTDLVIDPFGGGVIVTNDMLATMIPGFDPEEHLQPYGRRETVVRMLNNLVADFSQAQKTAQAELARELIGIVESYERPDPLAP